MSNLSSYYSSVSQKTRQERGFLDVYDLRQSSHCKDRLTASRSFLYKGRHGLILAVPHLSNSLERSCWLCFGVLFFMLSIIFLFYLFNLIHDLSVKVRNVVCFERQQKIVWLFLYSDYSLHYIMHKYRLPFDKSDARQLECFLCGQVALQNNLFQRYCADF